MEKFVEQKGNQLMANYQTKKFAMKEKMKEFFLDEKGNSNMVAVVLLVLIVVGIAVLFKEQIMNLINNLFGKINEQADGI